MRSARNDVAPVHDRDLGCNMAQIQGLLDRGVAAADDNDRLAAIEKSIAGRAGGYAIPLELRFRGNAEPSRLGAGRDHQRIACVDRAAVAREPEGRLPSSTSAI